MNQKNAVIFLVFIILVVAAFFVGRHSESPSTAEQKPLYWIDTMEPNVHYAHPGLSHMGMKLVPVYANQNQKENASTVQISPGVANNLGIRTAPVVQGSLSRKIQTVGYIEPNENKISHIHSYAEGWVRNLIVKSIGEMVKKNQLVLKLYAPTLVNAQEEYLIALGSANQDLIDASYKRLQSFNISDQQIQQLKATRKTNQLINVYSPQTGIVMTLNVREGMHVTPETEIMSIVDLTNIWMIAQVYEDQANWVKVGEKAQATIDAYPGQVWTGKVEYIYPQVDPTSRTLKVRFLFSNPGNILKPNMYTNITILAAPKANVLSIPLEALIQSSSGDRVIVATGNDFQVRSVTAGMESGNQVEIVSGLKAGEKVVASGQFLIDSEASLNAGLERIQTSAAPSQVKPMAVGIIKSINTQDHTITIQHEKITSLNWPAMTMEFAVDKSIDIGHFTVNHRVEFTIQKNSSGDFVITNMKESSP